MKKLFLYIVYLVVGLGLMIFTAGGFMHEVLPHSAVGAEIFLFMMGFCIVFFNVRPFVHQIDKLNNPKNW